MATHTSQRTVSQTRELTNEEEEAGCGSDFLDLDNKVDEPLVSDLYTCINMYGDVSYIYIYTCISTHTSAWLSSGP